MQPVRIGDLLVDLKTGAAVRLLDDGRHPVHLRQFYLEWEPVTALQAHSDVAPVSCGPGRVRRLLTRASGQVWSRILVVYDDLDGLVGPTVRELEQTPDTGRMPVEVACAVAARAGDAERAWGHGLVNAGGVCLGGEHAVVVFPHVEMGAPGNRHPPQVHLLADSPDPDDQRAWSLAVMAFRLLGGRPPMTVRRNIDLFSGILEVRSPPIPPRLRDLRDDVPGEIADVVDEVLGSKPAFRPTFDELHGILAARSHSDEAFLTALAGSTAWPPQDMVRAREQLLMIAPDAVPRIAATPLGPPTTTLRDCAEEAAMLTLT